jgi:hypothetical protein
MSPQAVSSSHPPKWTSLAILAVLLLAIPASARAGVAIAIDTPGANTTVRQPFAIGGWAIDSAATANSGIDAIHIYAYPNPGSGEAAIFIGVGSLGARPDVAAAFGAQFLNAGYGLFVRGLAPKTYMLAVFAHSSITGTFAPAGTVVVSVLADPRMNIDAPANNAFVLQPFLIGGWAIDLAAATGTGVNTVHVWAIPSNGGSAIMVGAAGEGGTYGRSRPDVGAAFAAVSGTQQFTPSGWDIIVNGLPPGEYDLVAYSFSLVAGGFTLNQSRHVIVDSTVPPALVVPGSGSFTAPVSVQLGVPPGAEVHFSRDGSTPTPGSELYTAPFTVSANTALRARAFRAGSLPSAVTAADYTFGASTPTFGLPPSQYTAPVSLTLATATPGASVFWTIDGTEPTTSSNPYIGPIPLSPGTVTVRAKAFRSGWTPSQTASGIYVIVVGTAATPVASPAPGTYVIGQTVTLSASVGTVRYTTDGSDPTASSPAFAGPIVLSVPTTIKARSFFPQFNPSAIVTLNYVLRTQTPTIFPPGDFFPSFLPIVSITSPVPGVTIRYTTDASTPTETSTLYAGPFGTTEDMSVIAIAFRPGWAPSDTAAENYQTHSQDTIPVPPSIGGVAQTGVNVTSTNALNATLSLSFDGASVTAVDDIGVSVNGTAATTSGTPANITVTGALADGENLVSVAGLDATGAELSDGFTIWAGSRTIPIQVSDWLSAPLSGASIRVAPAGTGDDIGFAATTNTGGSATATNMPGGETRVSVSAPFFRPTEVVLSPSQSSTAVTLDLDNNDFSQGLAGWRPNSSEVFVVGFSEVFPGWITCFDPACVRNTSQQSFSSGQMAAVGANVFSSSQPNAVIATANLAASQDFNIYVQADVGVAGEVNAVRQFHAAKGARAVTVRYRVASSEILSTTPRPDTYRVSITVGNTVTSDAGNVLQLSYDASTATAWRTLTAPVNDNEFVTITAGIANASDTKYPSLVEVDKVTETVYSGIGRLTQVVAFNQKGVRKEKVDTLHYLSAAPHLYGSHVGFTTVAGEIKVTGPADDSLASVILQIAKGPVYTDALHLGDGTLGPQAAVALLNRPLASGVSMTGTIFEINSIVFSLITDEKLSLRIKATTTSGKNLILNASQTVWAWSHFPLASGPSRYGDRDTIQCLETVNGVVQPGLSICNGDDWAFPGVVTWTRQLEDLGISVDDFSHMNGGSWRPHVSHQKGDDVDCFFPGYAVRDAKVFQRLLNLLGSTIGKNIAMIFVKFTPGFTAALAAAPETLPNGIHPRKVFKDDKRHSGHFHIRFGTRNP